MSLGPSALAGLSRNSWLTASARKEGWLIISQRPAEHLRLFTRGQGGTVWENTWDLTGWHQWRPIPGPAISGTSRPAALVDRTGIVHLFVQSQDQTLWENLEKQGQWSGWQAVPGRQLTPFAPVAGINRDGRQHLLVYARNGAFYENEITDNGWQGWKHISTNHTQSGPVAVANVLGQNGTVWLFTSGTQDAPFSLPYFIRNVQGRLLSLYPVILPVLIAPLYLPAVCLMQVYDVAFDNPRARTQALAIAILMEKLSASLIACLSVLFVYLALIELCERRTAFWLALLYALGTTTWTISSQALWQHGLSELNLSLLVYALLKARQHERWFWIGGLAAALVTANRPPLGMFSLLALLYVWHKYRQGLSRFLVGPILIGTLLLTYNFWYFGKLTGGYGDVLPLGMILHRILSGDYEGLLGILFSPNRGLFIYTPFVLFSCWGAFVLWRRGGNLLLRYMSMGVMGQIILYGMYPMWWGGWCFGPRFLTDIAPFFCFFLVPILSTLRYRFVAAPFVVAVVFSVMVQATGAFFYSSLDWDASPVSVDVLPERLWDWYDTQLLRSFNAGFGSGERPSVY